MDFSLLPVGPSDRRPPNVGALERGLSTFLGLALLAWGSTRRRREQAEALAAGAAGAYLAFRGVSGRCLLYDAAGLSTSDGVAPFRLREEPVEVRRSITVQRPRAEVFAFFRTLPNLPQFVDELRSVRVDPDGRTHWTVEPLGHPPMHWDAEIVSEMQDERIAWRSAPPSDFPHEGTVTFADAPGGRGTEVRVKLRWGPGGSRLGSHLARVLGRDPAHIVEEDLRRFRQTLESGEIATVAGQASGERA